MRENLNNLSVSAPLRLNFYYLSVLCVFVVHVSRITFLRQECAINIRVFRAEIVFVWLVTAQEVEVFEAFQYCFVYAVCQ